MLKDLLAATREMNQATDAQAGVAVILSYKQKVGDGRQGDLIKRHMLLGAAKNRLRDRLHEMLAAHNARCALSECALLGLSLSGPAAVQAQPQHCEPSAVVLSQPVLCILSHSRALPTRIRRGAAEGAGRVRAQPGAQTRGMEGVTTGRGQPRTGVHHVQAHAALLHVPVNAASCPL